MKDDIQHKQLRAELVETIKKKGISDEKVLSAIGAIPRHLFIDRDLPSREMYEDVALSIGLGQTISQPFTVAYQTQLLGVKEREKVLEIGTGSGYQSAVLFYMGAQVFSVERHRKLYQDTKEKLLRLGYSAIKLFYGDGHEGLPEEAPFDKIIITAAAASVPEQLITQLKYGGVMVLPVNGGIQKMLRITRLNETETRTESFGDFKFVPMLPGIEAD
jgi:protein-L-isoaspartate(D-aspartate) O-methyltransferase